MKREILINGSALEVRVALLESNSLAEFYLEREQHRSIVGNIYKGKVTRVLPGMQAAFVDIGMEKAGFLHASDFLGGLEAWGSVAEAIGEEVETEPVPGADESEASSDIEVGADAEETPEPSGGGRGRRGRRRFRRPKVPIEQQLRRNQEVIVQIAKESIGTKGPRLTSSISLAGRYLVYTPTSNHLGISRRIESAEERNRLRSIVSELRPPQGGGFIVRTACERISRREIHRDITFLTKTWQTILKKAEKSSPPAILHTDLDVALRTVRDLFSSEVERLWCDDPALHGRIMQFVRTYMPRLRSRVKLFEGEDPIFDHFKVEPQLERALDRRVPLKSGGYLVFDQAEALTAIDVNTGRFVGKKSQDETVLSTNLEAVDEVVRQLRLRNIGGIIIVDFIDMTRETDRKRVSDAFKNALKNDKARTSMLKISELGLVQMTRNRTRESLEEMLTVQCPRCQGRRVVKSLPTAAAEILRAIHREGRRRALGNMIMVKVSPDIARYLYDWAAHDLEELERRLDTQIVLRSKEGLELGAFELAQTPAAA